MYVANVTTAAYVISLPFGLVYTYLTCKYATAMKQICILSNSKKQYKRIYNNESSVRCFAHLESMYSLK